MEKKNSTSSRRFEVNKSIRFLFLWAFNNSACDKYGPMVEPYYFYDGVLNIRPEYENKRPESYLVVVGKTVLQ